MDRKTEPNQSRSLGAEVENTAGLLRSAIANVLPRPILKALYSPDGHGNFSTATFLKLQAAGLCDASYYWTSKGRALRAALKIEDWPHDRSNR